MKQQVFEDISKSSWSELENILGEGKKGGEENLPRLYRKVCHDLAIAKQRRYTPSLVDYLNHLVMQGHHRIYSGTSRYQFRLSSFFFGGFARVLRKNAKFVYLALILFLLPSVVTGILCYLDEEMVYSTMSYTQVQNLEHMYDPEAKVIGRDRESDTDIMMFGFYIKNNIGIGFRTFAGGVLFGLGSIFFLFYNGIVLGAAAGHLTQLGFDQTFYPFVVGHGAFELTAIVFSGAAGLMLGYSLINPGRNRRVVALRLAAEEAIQIMYGVVVMLVIAAFLEAFWSSSTNVPILVKYTVGSIFWLFVLVYCLFSGRSNAHGSQPD